MVRGAVDGASLVSSKYHDMKTKEIDGRSSFGSNRITSHHPGQRHAKRAAYTKLALVIELIGTAGHDDFSQ